MTAQFTMIFLIFVVYVGAMVVIGSLSLRQNKSFQDTITGAKQSSAVMLAGSCIAGQIGSGFIIGGTEYGVLYGVGGAWYGIACGLSCLVTVAMCRFIYTNGYISLTDYLINRYKAKATGIIYSGAMLVGGVAMLGGQLLAARAVLETLGIPAQWGGGDRGGGSGLCQSVRPVGDAQNLDPAGSHHADRDARRHLLAVR